MRVRTGWAAALSLAATAVLQTGCLGTVLKQGFEEVRGAHADLLPIVSVSELALAKYESVAFTPATTTIGDRLCPPGVRRAYDRSASQLLARLTRVYPGGPPTLTIDTDIVYFQKKGLFSGGQLLARVKMHGADQLVADALLKAETQSFRAGGEDNLARAAIQALQRFLVRYKQGSEPEAADGTNHDAR